MENQFYVDMGLPFGPRSAPYSPYIFTSIAHLVEWILKQNHGVDFVLHYQDDFHTLGPPSSTICQRIIYYAYYIHPDKLEGLTTCIVILHVGIERDTIKLPPCPRPPKGKFDLTACITSYYPADLTNAAAQERDLGRSFFPRTGPSSAK